MESLLTQIADAQKQISECEAEYAMVDLYLKDMELIDYISGEDREKLEDCAKAVHLLEEDKSRYEKCPMQIMQKWSACLRMRMTA